LLLRVVPEILSRPDEVKANREELTYFVPDLVAALPDAGQRAALGSSLIAKLDTLQADASLPIPDRLGTVAADIALGKDAKGKVSPAVLAKVRARTAWADATAKDAGDDAGARKLLVAEVGRSASPYYYMLALAGLAEETGDPHGAIVWARKAYEAAQGPATRVQWALEYSKTVLRQTPADKAAVEASADAVLSELDRDSGGYYQRTRTKVAAWGDLMREWSNAHDAAAAFARIEAKMAKVCTAQGSAQAQCRQWGHAA
jgi:protein disulfide-isomerase